MFQLIFNKVAEILMDPKRLSIFNEDSTLQDDDDVFYAYYCFKVGDEEIRKKIKNWIFKINNQGKFLSYFHDRAKQSNLIKEDIEAKIENFIRAIIYFDVALSCNLKNEDVTQCLTFILGGKKTPTLLLLQLKLLEIEKNSPFIDKSIEKHFEREFNCYFPLLKNDQFCKREKNLSHVKLILAFVLKKSTNWKEEDWESAAFQEYRDSFSILNHPNDQALLDAKSKRKWIEDELGPRLTEFRLWQKLRGSEKMLESIFGQIFSQDHLKILESYIQNQDKPEEYLLDVLLFYHEDLGSATKQWIEKLEQNLKKIPDSTREGRLIGLLNQLTFMKIIWDL